jgi:GNAT superfamily N-acetyltransferase
MDVRIDAYDGPHRKLASFREAEDSEQSLDSYIDLGRVWVARDTTGAVVAHLQAVPRDPATWEVTSTAVAERHRGHGVGLALLEYAVDEARRAGMTRVSVSTVTPNIGNLRFYQRCGFRMTHVVPDAFTAVQGYPDGIQIDGIPLRDQDWFERLL